MNESHDDGDDDFLTIFSYFLRINVTGIYRATPVRVNPRQRNVKSVYKVHIDVVHFRKSDKKRLHESDPDRYNL